MPLFVSQEAILPRDSPRFSWEFRCMTKCCSSMHATAKPCGNADSLITTLDADLDHPDSTFVEDTAVLTARSAILTRPGARSREGEVAAMRPPCSSFFPATVEIEAPGTLDGGDICEAGRSILPRPVAAHQ